jgi:hypothetical protein
MPFYDRRLQHRLPQAPFSARFDGGGKSPWCWKPVCRYERRETNDRIDRGFVGRLRKRVGNLSGSQRRRCRSPSRSPPQLLPCWTNLSPASINATDEIGQMIDNLADRDIGVFDHRPQGAGIAGYRRSPCDQKRPGAGKAMSKKSSLMRMSAASIWAKFRL